ncbi:hypothetical protein J7K24_03055 [bacterium]|nr:hypothetical protein [bacterium]
MPNLNPQILRKQYPEFLYQKYLYDIIGDNLEISFEFFIEPNIKFSPHLIIKNIKRSHFNKIRREVLDNLIYHLGLIEMISYWKTTCSPQIKIKTGTLSKEQIEWWKDLIINGMGQFFYENRIDWRKKDFIKIEAQKKPKKTEKSLHLYQEKLKNRVLIPIGGGKDSPVTVEILKKAKKQIGCFSLNPTPAAKQIIKIAGCKKPIIVERKIDPKLFTLNQKGFLNGHTPFSAYLAFLSVFLAIIFDYKYIAFSNERSANEGNLKYLGKIINHQYSKSFEFEKKFDNYCKKYLTPVAEYFSFLRPLYEIQIAKLFSYYPKYFPVFLSCNEAFKTYSGRKKPSSKWCGNCPKCLFIFALLYPFLNRIKMRKIFGENLFRKVSLLPLMEQLIGEKKFKPFECVGTKEESLIAFYLSWKKDKNRLNKPFLLKHFEKKILPRYKNLETEAKEILESWNKENNLPKIFEDILRKNITWIQKSS